MKTNIFNQVGEIVETMELPKEIFEISFNSDLVHQVVTSQAATKRAVIANVKGRGEVSGGGKKPWRQKGTGRARVGSNRSPIWRHGGIVGGPTKEKNYFKRIPKKMRRKALLMVLSKKLKDKEITFLNYLKIEDRKTKMMSEIIKKLREKIENLKTGKVLIALPQLDKNLILASRNLKELKVVQAKDLNPSILLSFKNLILPQESIKVIEENFLK